MSRVHAMSPFPRPIGGRGIPMFRLILFIALLYLICCGLALGQAVGGNNNSPGTNPRSAYAAPSITRPQPPAYYGQSQQAQFAQDSQNAQDPPAPTVGYMMQRSGGSLLQATLLVTPDPDRAKLANVSLIAVADPTAKTIKKHDFITVIIHEQGENSSSGTSALTKETDLDAKLNNFVELNLAKMRLTGVQPNVAPELNAQATRGVNTNGAIDRQDMVVDRITAEVLDVKPNNILVLQARKRIKADEEEQEFIMTGMCRAEDIAADNTVLSTQCFDLQIQKMNKGQVRDTNKKGFVPKLLDFINPF